MRKASLPNEINVHSAFFIVTGNFLLHKKGTFFFIQNRPPGHFCLYISFETKCKRNVEL